MLTLAYGVLAVAVLRTVFRLWNSPAQVVALILAMHGIDQVVIAGFPFIAARPYLINVTIGIITVSSLMIAVMRRQPASTPVGRIWLGSLLASFALLYALGVLMSGHAENDQFTGLIRGVIPYAVLQLILLPPIIARSSARELQEAFGMTGVLCVCIMIIVALDTSLHTAGTSAGTRVLLKMQGEQGTQASNSLALADVGVLALVMTLVVGVRSEWLARLAPGVASSSITGWIVVLISAPYLVWVMQISRTEPFAGVLALITTWLMQPRRNRLSPFAMVGLVVLMLCFVGVQLFDGLVEAVPQLRLLDDGFRVRMEFVRHSLDAYLNGGIMTLLFGLGPGYSYVTIGTYPHHHVIETITELGLCGMAIYGTILWYAARGARTLVVQARPALRGIVEVTTTMFVYSLVLSLKRGSVVAPDIFMWSFFIAEFLGRASKAKVGIMSRVASRNGPLHIACPLPRPA
jgi:hypothetical protein